MTYYIISKCPNDLRIKPFFQLMVFEHTWYAIVEPFMTLPSCSKHKRSDLRENKFSVYCSKIVSVVWGRSNGLCYCLCGMLNSECHMCGAAELFCL